jgi:hypothetical protein
MESGSALFRDVLLDQLVLAGAAAGDSVEPREVIAAVLVREGLTELRINSREAVPNPSR